MEVWIIQAKKASDKGDRLKKIITKSQGRYLDKYAN